MELLLEVMLLILTWGAILTVVGAALSIVIGATLAHDNRKRNWHKGTHDYYGNEIPKRVRELVDSDGV